jgi:type II secretory ATPase GspE/PulE/Tfp pilus assembly ATPase PilB-like protein
MLAGTFNVVMAERLVRKVCYHCKTQTSIKWNPQHTYALQNFKNFDKDLLKKEVLSRNISQEQRNAFVNDGMISVGTWKDPVTGQTCPVCKGSGYKWRVGLFEMMDYTDDLKALILKWEQAIEIESYALQHGMINLERDGIFKVIQWMTTLEEVYSYVKARFETK